MAPALAIGLAACNTPEPIDWSDPAETAERVQVLRENDLERTEFVGPTYVSVSSGLIRGREVKVALRARQTDSPRDGYPQYWILAYYQFRNRSLGEACPIHASDSDGHRILMLGGSKDVGREFTTQRFDLLVSREFLQAHSANGIRLRICDYDQEFFVPPAYILGFLGVTGH